MFKWIATFFLILLSTLFVAVIYEFGLKKNSYYNYADIEYAMGFRIDSLPKIRQEKLEILIKSELERSGLIAKTVDLVPVSNKTILFHIDGKAEDGFISYEYSGLVDSQIVSVKSRAINIYDSYVDLKRKLQGLGYEIKDIEIELTNFGIRTRL